MTDDRRLIWRPQPGPQEAFVTCPVFEVFFGGARGGGKTDAVLGEWAIHAGRHGQHAIGLMVRRTHKQLKETIERAREIYVPLGFRFTGNPANECIAPNGARLTFAYLDQDADAENYQGNSYTRVYVEEIGNFPSPKPIFKLMATLRSAHGVPCRFRATGNPGGPGHHWTKARYIDPAPLGWKLIPGDREGHDRIYIPSRVTDNRILLANDPGYVDRLYLTGNKALVRAWLEGDWDVIAGAFFPEFSTSRHVVEPCELPAHWTRFRSMDWGSAKPFSVGWWAVSDGTLPAFPRGALIRYREWYGASEPNVGLKLTAEQVAKGILEREKPGECSWGVLDPAAWAQDGGPSIAERMAKCGVAWRPADNSRVARLGALGGWDQLRQRLRGIDGRPMLYIFATCTELIRTLPALSHDERRPEDVCTEGEDHAADETRYACMARPMVRDEPKLPRPVHEYAAATGGRISSGITFAELMKRRERRRLEAAG
jgi:hypothetical protein